MFAVRNNPISAYQSTGVETGVASADPHKLILMLFEGAQLALAKARLHMQDNETEAKGVMISKAILIIDTGLKASIDRKEDNEIANNLYKLYDYMTHRLLVANLKNDQAILNEVSKLLSELYEAWEAIGENRATDSTLNVV